MELWTTSLHNLKSELVVCVSTVCFISTVNACTIQVAALAPLALLLLLKVRCDHLVVAHLN